MAGLRAGCLPIAAALALAAAGCEGSGGTTTGPAPMHALGSAARLRALLAHEGVSIRRGTVQPATSFPAAWKAFERFARLPVDRRDLSGDRPNDDLLFEFGVFESNLYGTSFEVELTRQYGMANGDLQQVHLVVHFPVAEFVALARTLRAAPCMPDAGCAFACFFADDDALVPHACKVVPANDGGYRVKDMTLWASETGPDDQAARRTAWIDAVRSFVVFRTLLARHVRPVGYEVWQDSAE